MSITMIMKGKSTSIIITMIMKSMSIITTMIMKSMSIITTMTMARIAHAAAMTTIIKDTSITIIMQMISSQLGVRQLLISLTVRPLKLH